MYCKNCANEVNDKAIACLKCGVDPRSENKFCPSCGNETLPNQIACTSCGVSLSNKVFNIDTSKVQTMEVKDLVKNKTFRFILALTVLAIGTYAYTEYASGLSKGKAKELISKKFNLPSPATEAVQHGLIRYGWSRPEKELLLQENGLLTCVAKPDLGYNVYQVDITPKGKKYKISDSTDRAGLKYYIMRVADREFGEITSLQESSDKTTAVAEFTVIYKNIIPIKELVYLLGESDAPVKDGKAIYKDKASFSKTQDGWKISDGKNIIQDTLDELRERSGGY